MQAENTVEVTLWRKLLALRVWALCVAGLFITFLFINWLDTYKPDIPKWIETVLMFLAVLPFLMFLYALAAGGADLVVHFIPEGRIRRLLLKGNRSPETIAKEFGETGYLYALLPFVLAIGLAAIGIVVVIIFGGLVVGFAALSALWNSIFGGWPPWAIVITLLLVALLIKK